MHNSQKQENSSSSKASAAAAASASSSNSNSANSSQAKVDPKEKLIPKIISAQIKSVSARRECLTSLSFPLQSGEMGAPPIDKCFRLEFCYVTPQHTDFRGDISIPQLPFGPYTDLSYHSFSSGVNADKWEEKNITCVYVDRVLLSAHVEENPFNPLRKKLAFHLHLFMHWMSKRHRRVLRWMLQVLSIKDLPKSFLQEAQLRYCDLLATLSKDSSPVLALDPSLAGRIKADSIHDILKARSQLVKVESKNYPDPGQFASTTTATTATNPTSSSSSSSSESDTGKLCAKVMRLWNILVPYDTTSSISLSPQREDDHLPVGSFAPSSLLEYLYISLLTVELVTGHVDLAEKGWPLLVLTQVNGTQKVTVASKSCSSTNFVCVSFLSSLLNAISDIAEVQSSDLLLQELKKRPEYKEMATLQPVDVYKNLLPSKQAAKSILGDVWLTFQRFPALSFDLPRAFWRALIAAYQTFSASTKAIPDQLLRSYLNASTAADVTILTTELLPVSSNRQQISFCSPVSSGSVASAAAASSAASSGEDATVSSSPVFGVFTVRHGVVPGTVRLFVEYFVLDKNGSSLSAVNMFDSQSTLQCHDVNLEGAQLEMLHCLYQSCTLYRDDNAHCRQPFHWFIVSELSTLQDMQGFPFPISVIPSVTAIPLLYSRLYNYIPPEKQPQQEVAKTSTECEVQSLDEVQEPAEKKDCRVDGHTALFLFDAGLQEKTDEALTRSNTKEVMLRFHEQFKNCPDWSIFAVCPDTLKIIRCSISDNNYIKQLEPMSLGKLRNHPSILGQVSLLYVNGHMENIVKSGLVEMLERKCVGCHVDVRFLLYFDCCNAASIVKRLLPMNPTIIGSVNPVNNKPSSTLAHRFFSKLKPDQSISEVLFNATFDCKKMTLTPFPISSSSSSSSSSSDLKRNTAAAVNSVNQMTDNDDLNFVDDPEVGSVIDENQSMNGMVRELSRELSGYALEFDDCLTENESESENVPAQNILDQWHFYFVFGVSGCVPSTFSRESPIASPMIVPLDVEAAKFICSSGYEYDLGVEKAAAGPKTIKWKFGNNLTAEAMFYFFANEFLRWKQMNNQTSFIKHNHKNGILEFNFTFQDSNVSQKKFSNSKNKKNSYMPTPQIQLNSLCFCWYGGHGSPHFSKGAGAVDPRRSGANKSFFFTENEDEVIFYVFLVTAFWAAEQLDFCMEKTNNNNIDSLLGSKKSRVLDEACQSGKSIELKPLDTEVTTQVGYDSKVGAYDMNCYPTILRGSVVFEPNPLAEAVKKYPLLKPYVNLSSEQNSGSKKKK